MNSRMKRRLIAVSGIIVIVMAVVFAFVGSGTAAKTATIAEAVSGNVSGQKIQVSGNVVENSFSTEDNVLTFKIYDPQSPQGDALDVRYEGAASSTFGNDVTAICTGRLDDAGVLVCSELVTKCPSKYESGASALSVSRLAEYGDEVVGKVVKVAGKVGEGSLAAAGAADARFTLVDASGSPAVAVLFDGALSNDIAEGSSVVLTGSVDGAGKFAATDVALER